MDPVAMRELFAATRARSSANSTPLQFANADLRGAFLLRADLNGGSFQKARFDHASLSGSHLVGTNLQSASLVGSDLNGADLTGATLSGADLSEARVEGACFSGADCRGSCLRNLRGHPASVAGMRLDHAACARSELDDAHVIQLWRDGAMLEDLKAFSQRVRHACRDDAPDTAGLDFRSRDVAIAEAQRRTSLMPERPASLREAIHFSIPANRILNLFGDTGAAHEPGDEFLGVTLVKCIGEGPNGSVWKARCGSDERPCAVKLFAPKGGFHETQAGVFKRGTDTLNRIAVLDESGRTRVITMRAVALNGLGFVYDYYDNGNMTGICVLGWDLTRVLVFFGEICRAVGELHELGIAHRALKPQNVLVDEQLRPVLADAGMLGFTSPDLPLPTPDMIYRAPEELGGESTLSPTADVYSLGRLLWCLLLGRNPDEQVQGVAALESLQKYPAGIVRIIRKATAEDPAVRYQWVRELEKDLASYRLYEQVGISGLVADNNLKPYCVSSLPAPRIKLPANGVIQPAPNTFAKVNPAMKQTCSSRIWPTTAATLGLGCATCAAAVMLVPNAPTPAAVRWAAVAIAGGIALTTLLLKPMAASPRLSRLVIFAGAWLLLGVAGPERLAVQRWRFTLSHASLANRAKAAKYLARQGARDLSHAELPGTDLHGADFGCAVLRNANLTRANLAGANLAEADLTGTRLSEVNLKGTNLLGSSMEKALGLSTSECSRQTRFPKGWRCEAGHPNRY